jgi:hypothetical protein
MYLKMDVVTRQSFFCQSRKLAGQCEFLAIEKANVEKKNGSYITNKADTLKPSLRVQEYKNLYPHELVE